MSWESPTQRSATRRRLRAPPSASRTSSSFMATSTMIRRWFSPRPIFSTDYPSIPRLISSFAPTPWAALSCSSGIACRTRTSGCCYIGSGRPGKTRDIRQTARAHSYSCLRRTRCRKPCSRGGELQSWRRKVARAWMMRCWCSLKTFKQEHALRRLEMHSGNQHQCPHYRIGEAQVTAHLASRERSHFSDL